MFYINLKNLPVDTVWKKTSLTLPAFIKQYKISIMLQYSGENNVEFDEASLMSSNNFLGIRNEYKKLFEQLKPGIIRYPGGCFADVEISNWKAAITPIDQRTSPNYGYGPIGQRLDWGTDEYMALCKSLNIEPYLVVNYGSGTPELARDWVEYCNCDTNTTYGKLRAANGHPEPYHVKYWEIGNEQWDNLPDYAKRYLVYYNEMKKLDSTLRIVICGNCWDPNSFDTLFSIVHKNTQIYSYHPVKGVNRFLPGADKDKYLVMMSDEYAKNFLDFYESKREEYNFNDIMFTSDEWWTSYSSDNWEMLLDTNIMNSTLEAGLSNAIEYLAYLNNPNLLEFACRTIGIGFIRSGIDSIGKKLIYGTPAFWALTIASREHGTKVFKTSNNSEHYHNYDSKYWVDNTPWMNFAVTGTDDTLYIAVVNKYINNDSTFINIHMNFKLSSDTITVYELYSDNYLDANTANNPLKVVPNKRTELYSPELFVKNHSLTIFAIPINTKTDVDTNTTFTSFCVSPEPVENYMKIRFDKRFFEHSKIYENSIIDAEIYSILGKQVFKRSAMVIDNSITLNCSSLSKGFYIIKIKIGNECFTKKFIKI